MASRPLGADTWLHCAESKLVAQLVEPLAMSVMYGARRFAPSYSVFICLLASMVRTVHHFSSPTQAGTEYFFTIELPLYTVTVASEEPSVPVPEKWCTLKWMRQQPTIVHWLAFRIVVVSGPKPRAASRSKVTSKPPARSETACFPSRVLTCWAKSQPKYTCESRSTGSLPQLSWIRQSFSDMTLERDISQPDTVALTTITFSRSM
mmetsp:Transcript_25966/g.74983  ORF Transcript_25966/g.74983 Transcript_25966/m.74983 type:complete len:206 (-) Transcript_25966:2065-2682(-)